MDQVRPLSPHPDRLLPADPGVRAIARRLYQQVGELPIISPHGHVPAAWIARDEPFADPVQLLVSPDHYVTRLLHANGVPLAELGVGGTPLDAAGSRRAWRHFCEHWTDLLGTASGYWLACELAEVLGVTATPSAATADALYDELSETLATPDARPRALLRRAGVEVLATTDDPCDDLADHAAVAADPDVATRVLPTFRPDRYLEPARPGWRDLTDRLAAAAGVDTGDYDGFVAALEARRRYFAEHGAVSTDHSHADTVTLTLEPAEARRIYAAARTGTAGPEECTALRRHLLVEMARMSVEDGLVMTLHPAVCRDHHGPTAARFGADVGGDVPVAAEFTRSLRHLLQRFGTAAGFHLVLFTLDETTYSREIAPLAGFYPSVYVGAPWWFLDAPATVRRHRDAVTETAGFTRYSGFVDDTRALLSVPARHDMSRRLDCGHLAGLVAEHRLDEDQAADIARDLVQGAPRRVFKL